MIFGDMRVWDIWVSQNHNTIPLTNDSQGIKTPAISRHLSLYIDLINKIMKKKAICTGMNHNTRTHNDDARPQPSGSPFVAPN